MTYKIIEDINWDEMPEGAVEFALENDNYIACWYNENGEYSSIDYYSGWHEAFIDPEDPEDNRVRYKVSDYHPSATTNRKPTREERLDKALRALIQRHFFGEDLEWSWKEGKSLKDADSSLHAEIVDLLEVGE